MKNYPRVAIVYLSYHSEQYLDDFYSALKNISYPKDRIEVVIVDNPHPEFGSSHDKLVEKFSQGTENIPHVTLLPQKENLGFAGGNNVGIRWALEQGFDYVFCHNDDGFMASDCLENMIRAFEADHTIGCGQALMFLHPDTHLLNSAGNAFHYLGFGYCMLHRTPAKDFRTCGVTDIGYASGASMLMRCSLLRQYGAWDEDLFLYHEDLEYSLRLRSLGFRIVLIPDAFFYHKYQFSRSITKYFYMERNRYAVLLMYFRLPTLLLLLPIGIAVELGMWYFAIKKGWWREKRKVYLYWFRPTNVRLWIQKRKKLQKLRKVSDASLLQASATSVLYQEKAMNSLLLEKFGNPVMKLYFDIVLKNLIRW